MIALVPGDPPHFDVRVQRMVAHKVISHRGAQVAMLIAERRLLRQVRRDRMVAVAPVVASIPEPSIVYEVVGAPRVVLAEVRVCPARMVDRLTRVDPGLSVVSVPAERCPMCTEGATDGDVCLFCDGYGYVPVWRRREHDRRVRLLLAEGGY